MRNVNYYIIKAMLSIIVFLIVFAGLVDIALYLLYKVHISQLNIWSSFLADMFGGIATLVAIIITVNNNKNVIKYQLQCQNRPIFHNIKFTETYKEDNIYCSLKICCEGSEINHSECKTIDNKDMFINTCNSYNTKLTLKNIGIGPAMNLVMEIIPIEKRGRSLAVRVIDSIKSDIRNKDDKRIRIADFIDRGECLSFLVQLSSTSDLTISFVMSYEDIVGNRYAQKQFVKYNKDKGEILISQVP